MKKKTLVTSKELRDYLKKQGINKQELFSLNRMTKGGFNDIVDVIKHFTNAKPHKGGIQIQLDSEKSIESGDMGEVFNSSTIIDIETLRDKINEILDFRNYAVEQINDITARTELLTDKEKEAQYEVMKNGMAQIEHLNAIIKEKGSLHLSDLNLEVLEPIVEARLKSREMLALMEQREQRSKQLKKEQRSKQLKNQKNNIQDKDQER